VERPTVIVGGGVIGVCCASFLAKRGARVIVLERDEIGTSYGNAGCIAPGHPPINRPGRIRQALKSLFNPLSPLYVAPRPDPALAKWLWKFSRTCTERHVDAAVRTLASRPGVIFMSATRTLTKDISQENRADHPVMQHLQRQVAHAFVLYANYKHYHWQTFGPHFRDPHLMFDHFAKEVLGTIDERAERIRMIGQDIEHVQLKQMQEAANVHSSVPGQTMSEMIEEAAANSLVVIKDLRDGARSADESNDPGTVDLFSKIVQIHEKQEWFLRELLKKKDGFVRLKSGPSKQRTGAVAGSACRGY